MARTAKELAARLREGYEANNWAPALEVLAELEASAAPPPVAAAAEAVEAASCGDPVLGEHGEEGHAEEDAGDEEDDPFGGGASGLPDRAGEDGEERPGLHDRSRSPKRPVRRRR
jgi:hypothetical protein